MKKRFWIFTLSLFALSSVIAKPQYCSLECSSDTFCGTACTLSSGAVVTCGDYTSLCSSIDVIPYYYPSYWNTSSTTRLNNNCYNYAANKKTNDYAQPGHKSGHPGFNANKSCAGVMAGAAADSGIYSSDSSASYPDTLLAVVVAPGYDYHFYRRDKNSKWSHKPGQTTATNLDKSGNIINDPVTANHGIYTDFCGYVKTKSKCRDNNCLSGLYGADQNKGIANIGRMAGLGQQQTEESPIARVSELEAVRISDLKAEILVYSGMPNPIVSFPAKSAISKRLATLNAQIQNDPFSIASTLNPSDTLSAQLGYKGILLTDSSGKILPENRQLHIFNNELRVIDSNNRTAVYHLMDINLEQDILNNALSQGKITQALRDTFKF